MMRAARLSTLLEWCAANGIWIDSRLSVEEDAQAGGICIRNVAASLIECAATLVTIPKTAVLSVRSCTLSDDIPFVPCGHGAHLGLALALYGELLQEGRSRWTGYLQSLPRETVGIAMLWGIDGRGEYGQEPEHVQSDSRRASTLAIGTEIERELGTEDDGRLLDEVQEYYATVAVPILSSSGIPSLVSSALSVTLEGFLHAYALVSSRAFLVDAFHGLSMVPIADAFNHTQENHVHLESEIDVCVTCGSLAQCPHDQEEQLEPVSSVPTPLVDTSRCKCDDDDILVGGSKANFGTRPAAELFQRRSAAPNTHTDAPTLAQEVDTCDMVSNSPIPPGAEVFNTYGEHLTNAQLLARYGFALDDNDNDVVTFELDDLSVPPNITNCWPCADRAALDALYGEVLRAWPRHNWDNSEIVYQPEVGPLSAEMGSTPSGGRLASARDARTLAVNSDGKISHGLWVYCTLCSMSCVAPIAGNTGAPHAVTVAAAGRRLAELQVHKEVQGVNRPHEEATADDDGGDGDLPQLVGSTDKILTTLARVVTWACTQSPRARRLGRLALDDAGDPPSTAALGDMLDALPPTHVRTRLALTQVLSERSMLESCAAAWAEFGSMLSGGRDGDGEGEDADENTSVRRHGSRLGRGLVAVAEYGSSDSDSEDRTRKRPRRV